MTNSLFITFFIFFLNIFLNYLYLKKNKIESEIKHYFTFFMITPVALYFFIAVVNHLVLYDFLTYLELFNSIILYFFLSFALIMTVPAFNITPPTLKIISLFKNKDKINKKEILRLFTRSELVDSRLDLLIKDNLIILKDNKILLTRYGNLILSLFVAYKKIIGEEFGSG